MAAVGPLGVLGHRRLVALSGSGSAADPVGVTSPTGTRPAFRSDEQIPLGTGGLRSSAIRDLLQLTQRSDVLSLAGGLPADEAIPVPEVREAAAEVLAEGPWVLQYSSTEGMEGLRSWIRSHLRLAADWDVLVCTGSQQALHLLALAAVPPGEVVAIEDPSYLGAIQAFAAVGARWLPVPVGHAGLDVSRLEDALRAGARPRVCYTTPSLHNPTGATLDDEGRSALGALADRYGFLVVEDDPYGHLRWAGAAPRPMSAFTERCARVGSFSKLLAPGLRVGWLAGPAALVRQLTLLKQAADLHTSALDQRLVEQIVSRDGWLEHHVRRILPLYRSRAEALSTALRQRLGARVEFVEPEGGLFVWARIAGVDTGRLLPIALDHGVAFVPGPEFSIETRHHGEFLRLAFARLDRPRLEEATARLADAVAHYDRTVGVP